RRCADRRRRRGTHSSVWGFGWRRNRSLGSPGVGGTARRSPPERATASARKERGQTIALVAGGVSQHGAQEVLGALVLGFAEDLVGPSLLDDRALVEHHHAVGDVLGELHL